MLDWEGARHARVELTLLDAADMGRLNRRVTGRRGLTDVIAFALPQPDGSLVGEIYICPEAAWAWVRSELQAFHEELVRLTVHGTLHILGHDHPEGRGRTRSTMWRRQEGYVRRVLDGKR